VNWRSRTGKRREQRIDERWTCNRQQATPHGFAELARGAAVAAAHVPFETREGQRSSAVMAGDADGVLERLLAVGRAAR